MTELKPVEPQPDEQCARKASYDPGRLGCPPGFFCAPEVLLEHGAVRSGEQRLSDELTIQLRAALGRPVALLACSAEQFLAGHAPWATALADLAVSGRAMYAAFQAAPPSDADVIREMGGGASDAAHTTAAASALDRAYAVAAALRNGPQERVSRRPVLGYVAVCGEVDPPHRPVNVRDLGYAQFEIPVTVPPVGIAVPTRFVVARSTANAAEPQPNATFPGRAPLTHEPFPDIPADDRIIIYVHDHMSSAEEAADLIPQLHRVGHELGLRLTVIAFDQPNSGYSGDFDHQRWMPGESRYPDAYPALQYLEDFVVAFIGALDATFGGTISPRIAAVVGGGLGGTLCLRLGRRPGGAPFLRKVAAWSPASVWPSWAHRFSGAERGVQDVVDRMMLQSARGTMNDAEDVAVPNSRRDYFAQVYDHEQPVPLVPAQPTHWYRDDWQPCKSQYVYESRWARREVYRASYRRWHWRTAFEMTVYSLRDPEPGSARPRYGDITAATLLAAGSENHGIYENAVELAGEMRKTPGNGLFLQHTGHAIQNERPYVLAKAILKLGTPTTASQPLDPEGNPFGEPCTWPEQTDPAMGQFLPTVPLMLHWVGPGLTDPGC